MYYCAFDGCGNPKDINKKTGRARGEYCAAHLKQRYRQGRFFPLQRPKKLYPGNCEDCHKPISLTKRVCASCHQKRRSLLPRTCHKDKCKVSVCFIKRYAYGYCPKHQHKHQNIACKESRLRATRKYQAKNRERLNAAFRARYHAKKLRLAFPSD